MTQIPDLIELSGIGSNTTYSATGAAHQILGIVDNATYTGDDDNSGGQIVELNDTASDGGILTIGGVGYTIDLVVPDNNTVNIGFVGGGSTNVSGGGGSSQIAFIIATPIGGGPLRYFAAVDDGVGDLNGINAITTNALDFTPLGSDVRINLEENNATSAVCFVAGTRIQTPDGQIPVERLRPGMLVDTMDNGPQELRWLGMQKVSAAKIRETPSLAPIRFAPGALGHDRPRRALYVSRQHRMLLRTNMARRYFGCPEILVPAVKLVGMPGVEHVLETGDVAYFHLLFDNHEIVFAENAAAESPLRGREALKAVSPEALAEIEALFPEALEENLNAAARLIPSPSAKLGKLLRRHADQERPVFNHHKQALP